MKKILLGCLLLTACNIPTAIPATALFPTATFLPTPVLATVPPRPKVTAIPSQSPTPEFTATPFPRFFTDEFDTLQAGWVILQAGSDATPDVKAENSNLLLQMDSPYIWAYALYGAQDYDDIRIDAQFANQAGTPAAIGLICRYSESDGWFEYNVLTDGTYSVLYGKWLANGVADYFPIASAASGAIQPSGAVQAIGLICSGTTLSLLIDRNIIRSINVSRYELAEGKVGIAAASFENAPVVAAFDWVKVSEP
jgi:hypothetical protein